MLQAQRPRKCTTGLALAVAAARWGSRSCLASLNGGEPKKNICPQVFLILTTTRLVLLPPFPFFPSSPHSITASPPIDNFSLRCLGACQFPLPSSSFSPASAFVHLRLLEQRLLILIRSGTAFVASLFPTAKSLPNDDPCRDLALSSSPIPSSTHLFESYKRRLRNNLDLYISCCVLFGIDSHRPSASARSRLATKLLQHHAPEHLHPATQFRLAAITLSDPVTLTSHGVSIAVRLPDPKAHWCL